MKAKTKKKISWTMERRKKYLKKADKASKPSPGTRKKVWVPAYKKGKKTIKGTYRKNPAYKPDKKIEDKIAKLEAKIEKIDEKLKKYLKTH